MCLCYCTLLVWVVKYVDMKKVTKADLINTKAGKYLVERHKGKTKRAAAIQAGYSKSIATHAPHNIENTIVYQELERKFFKDELIAQTTLKELGEVLMRNIKQKDNIAASNQAIQIALNKLEPEENTLDDSASKVLVVLR